MANRKVGAAKFGALGMAAVALGCAAMAAFFVGNMLTAQGYTGSRTRPVVVAKRDLPAAAQLAATDLEVVSWPEQNVPAGAFDSIETLLARGEGAAVPAVGILAGEPVVASRLSREDSGTAMARLVRPNMRAFALQVDDSIGFTGLVYPGAYVDVIVTIRDPMGRGPSSRIGVQNARVLSVGAETDVATRRVQRRDGQGNLTNTPQKNATYVTLEVSPQEAEILSIARNEGKLDLVLRNGQDDGLVETTGATPARFSAWAAVDADGGESDGVGAGGDDERVARVKRGPVRKRRIQIKASDEPDVAEAKNTAAKGIEIHYAN